MEIQEFLNLRQAAQLCCIPEASFRKLATARKMPCYAPTGRKLLFKRSELIAWIERGRIMSNDELISKAHASLVGV